MELDETIFHDNGAEYGGAVYMTGKYAYVDLLSITVDGSFAYEQGGFLDWKTTDTDEDWSSFYMEYAWINNVDAGQDGDFISVDCEFDPLDTKACKFVLKETIFANVASNYSPSNLFYVENSNLFAINGLKVNNFLGTLSTNDQTLLFI